MSEPSTPSKNHPGPVDLSAKFATFDEVFAPRRVAHFNGEVVKIAKLEGEFVWHRHEATDELFFVHRGEMTVRYRDREVILGPGQLHVVPRGVEHATYAAEPCEAVIIERAETRNTGEHADHAQTRDDEPFV